ncbi:MULTISPECIES: ABC transporter permease [unclassified Beijerinckia]|uniref:ABC transporter permease n=1 Tax=unclassified Beijerinckia TaxID=2638183 RepID=UPI00089D3EFB|nr:MULTISPECIES: ABC transporter permease [unclassified Beijerinckia]MDH7798721.1 sulfonate transport system permease protein [Beijerinckia sp. GAS462]SED30807.1 sulfonate transport system permease protein [Beijerinckia sp. 28-YEA-48]
MNALSRPLRRAIVPLAILVIWQVLASYGVINRRFSSSPYDIGVSLGTLASNGQLTTHLGISLWRAAFGLFVGTTAALAAGIFAGLSKVGEDAVDSTIQAIRTLPFLGLVPLFILWFGLGETPRILLVALGSFFPVYLNVFKGIRSVDERLIELGRSYKLSQWRLVRDIIFPAALPSALVGLRYAIGISWLSLVVAEQINSSSGLGWLIVQANELAQTSVIMTALAIYAVIGVLADALVRLIEQRALRWQRSFKGA